MGTVVRPRVGGHHKRSVTEGVVFVRWDNGVIANYRISAGSRDLLILRSASSGMLNKNVQLTQTGTRNSGACLKAK